MKTAFDLKEHRKRLSLTQAALAERLGCAPNTIARWERGDLQVPAKVRQTLEAWTTGPAARLPVPDLVTIDSFHSDIVSRLDGPLDDAVFESCAADLLKEQWPQLVPVPGGGDDGFDGALPGKEGARSWPLIVTTARDSVRNLRRSLNQAITTGHQPKFAIFATARSLTPRQRSKLEAAAAALGVTLQQIYDRSWFANALYRNPEWCRKLLGLTGNPDALSKLPASSRAIHGPEMLGRATELAKARETKADVILVGGPGSGKTTLLQCLADEGYFLWGGARDAVANSIRRHGPTLIFVDDAQQLDFTQLEELTKLRRQLGATFRIVASVWPPYRAKARESLPNAEEVSLSELNADLIADIIRSIVPDLPNPAIREIVTQAEGRPGLAATLAQLCVDGRFRDVMTGDALFERLIAYAADDRELLGCFALAGNAGLLLEDVATFLRRSRDDVQRSLTHLAAGGIIRVSNSKHVSVWPEQLRHVLVREVFFDQDSALPHDPLLARVSNRIAPLRVLIGATRCGAQVPWLRSKLEEVNKQELWSAYASLDATCAGYVLDRHPEMLINAAPAFLWHLPDRALPKLFDAIAKEAPFGDREGPALSTLRDWLRRSSMDEQVLVKRSQETARAAIKWSRRPENNPAALIAFCIAMSPNWEYAENDPGKGITFTLHHGVLGVGGLTELTALWKEVAPDLLRLRVPQWVPIFHLLREWVHPNAMVLLSADTVRTMQCTACEMVHDLVPITKGHPGAERRLAEFAEKLDVALKIEESAANADLGVLFPSPDWDSELDFRTEAKRHYERAGKWARERMKVADAGAVVRSVLSLQRQVKEAGTPANSYVGAAFEEFARSSTNPTDWIAALVNEEAEPSLVWPFVRRIVNEGGDVEDLLEHLKERRYRALLAEAAAMAATAHPGTVAWAIENAGEYTTEIAGQVRLGHVAPDRVLKLLDHRDVGVRAAMAIAYSIHEKEISGDIATAWRRAVIDTARVAELPGHDDYWLKKILKEDPILGAEWLKAYLEAGSGDYSMREVGLEIVKRLPSEAKEELLRSAGLTPPHADFVAELVGGEPKLYEVLLERSALAELHLEPLRPFSRYGAFRGPTGPRHGWPDLSCMALARGFSEEDVFHALLPRSWGFSGSEAAFWDGWREGYAKYEAHPDAAVRRIASRAKEDMHARVAEARERERITAVRGI